VRDQPLAADDLAVGIWLTEQDGRIRAVNATAASMLGYVADDLAGRTLGELVHPDDLARRTADFSDGEVRVGRRRMRHRDGHFLVIEGRARMRSDGVIVTAVYDVTALVRVEEELQRSSREKDAFLAMMSRELRNPLAPVRHALEVIDRAPTDSAEARGALEVLHRQVGYLSRLVDDLLDVARISDGKIELSRSRVDVMALVAATIADHRALFADGGIALAVELAAGPVWIDGDPTRIVQIVGNVLHNALTLTPSGGHVGIRARVEGDAFVVEVRDDGPGIEPAVLARLFEPFVPTDDSIDRGRGGLGLALTLARRLVELHGGAISARSPDGPGRGTSITITIPVGDVASAPAPSTSAAPASAAVKARARVLVVEDNVDAAEMLQILLELDGHQVSVAHDGHAAIAMAHALRPDVVLCDLGLPGIDGFEVARRLRRDTDPIVAAMPLVALTGYARREDRNRATEAGFTRHLAKPADPDALRRVVAELTARVA
jgi:PAS domain S-box-containing protein